MESNQNGLGTLFFYICPNFLANYLVFFRSKITRPVRRQDILWKCARQGVRAGKRMYMNWMVHFLNSSLGKKLIMSLTGIFLMLFLIVHLAGNIRLLYADDGKAFTDFVVFMEHNPFIKIIAWGLYLLILLHAIQGVVIWLSNRRSKGKTYLATTRANASWASRNMFYLGLLIFVFIVIHMGDFWLKLKVLHVYDDDALYENVIAAFKIPGYVILYEVAMVVLFFHLNHGFQSAFQTLGIHHRKYTPVIKALGWIYSIIVPLGFFIIPLYIYFLK